MPGLHLFTNTVNKLVRIRRLTEPLTQRKMRFRRTRGTQLLVDQLRQFPNAANDDGPDALEGARVRHLGRKSVLVELLGSIGSLEPADRGRVGKEGNAARKAIDTNLATTGYANRAAVVASTAEVFLSRSAPDGSSFSLVLLDPPYGFDGEAWSELLNSLARLRDVELVVLESGEEIPIDPLWDVVRMKWYGGTLLTILQPSNPPPDDQQLEPT
jgi:hypothetical protein